MPISPEAQRMMGADSNCLSFIIDAFEGIETPSDALAEQRIALARIFFYTGQTFFATRTIKAECDAIPDPVLRAKHESWMLTHFGVLPVSDPEAIARRALHFQQFHRKERDCTILAEAEDSQLAVLLCFDSRFVRRLAGKSPTVELMEPLTCWNRLGIPRGSAPKQLPRYDNPLIDHSWWRWDS